jgi:hypothetical protein
MPGFDRTGPAGAGRGTGGGRGPCGRKYGTNSVPGNSSRGIGRGGAPLGGGRGRCFGGGWRSFFGWGPKARPEDQVESLRAEINVARNDPAAMEAMLNDLEKNKP